MSKKCQGFCNRIYDEYYVVGSRILCAKCWEKELDDLRYKLREIDRTEQQKTVDINRTNHQMDMEYRKMQQQHDMKYDDISRQVKNLDDEIRIKTQNREWYEYESEDSYNAPKPYNYEEVQILRNRLWKLKEEERNRYKTNPKFPIFLKPEKKSSDFSFQRLSPDEIKLNQLKNAKYYTPEEAKFQEQAERDTEKKKKEEEREKEKELEQKSIAEAQKLLKDAKAQNQNKTLKKVLEKIAEIELLIQKRTLSDSLKAIEMLKGQYNWQLNEKESFEACLINFDKEKVAFETKRQKNILQARVELIAARQSITKDKTGQTKSVISNIEALVKKETNTDAEEAIRLLGQKYTWKTTTGKSFSASLSDFDSSLARNEEIERKEKKRIQEAKRKAEQQRQETERLAEQRRKEAERKKREAQQKKEAEQNRRIGCVGFITLAIIIGIIAAFSNGLGLIGVIGIPVAIFFIWQFFLQLKD